MTLTITLTPEEEIRIQQEAAARGLATEEYARQRLLGLNELEDDLSEEEIAEIQAGIRRGLGDVAAGRVTPFAEWAAHRKA